MPELADNEAITLVREYLDIFFSGTKPQRLRELLDSALRFRGPFATFDTADDYIRHLAESPCKDCHYDELQVIGNAYTVFAQYHFAKPGVSTTMMQRFLIRNHRISEITLVFDSAAFQGQ